VVHTFPGLTDLAAARPDIAVDWLVDESFAGFAGLHPAVGEVIAYPERRLRWPPLRWPARLRTRSALRRKLQGRPYDLVVDLQGLVKSVRAARLAGRPISGYDADSIREPLASRHYARKYAVARDLHAVERNRQLLAAAVGYAMPQAFGAFGLGAVRMPASVDLPERYGLVVHSASWPSKHWPEDRWRRLVGHLSARGIAAVLPWGNDAEKARAERIAAGDTLCRVLPVRLDGGELAGVVGNAAFAVGLDSGLMHLAAAYEVPGVWLFGPTDPGLTGPYGSGQALVQSTAPHAPCRTRDCAHGPAGGACMDLVDFAQVAAAVDTLSTTTG
jgi:heptosyltransferase-1